MIIDTSKTGWYKKNAELQKEMSFHEKRITFLILNDEILFLKNSNMSHYTWAKGLGIAADEFDAIVRGFYFSGKAIFYKGNFIYDDECIKKAKQFAPQIKEFCNIDKLEIWCGLKIGEIGELWQQQLFIGMA